MLIYPAIDLVNGEVVRLFQGDYNKKDVYGTNPSEFAAQFYQEGARCLHLVDLDGAKAGSPQNMHAVKQILNRCPSMLIEIGGGIRTRQTIEDYLEIGVKRIILGTAALKTPEFLRQAVENYGEFIVVGVDARDGKVATEGWLETSDTDSVSFCKEMKAVGVQSIIYTDIACDGAGLGTNLKIYEKLSQIDSLNITASGGISTLSDLIALKQMNLYAAIVGKALYTNQLQLVDALAACQV